MSEEKKIIIDEDWKSQVEAEKENLAQEQSQDAAGDSSAAGQQQLPPASFEMLLTSLATEAMMCLGQMPNMVTGQIETNIPQARYAIDMLQMIEEKTKGNLSPEEQQAIEGVLHQLRMLFVATQQGPGTEPPSSPIVGAE